MCFSICLLLFWPKWNSRNAAITAPRIVTLGQRNTTCSQATAVPAPSWIGVQNVCGRNHLNRCGAEVPFTEWSKMRYARKVLAAVLNQMHGGGRATLHEYPRVELGGCIWRLQQRHDIWEWVITRRHQIRYSLRRGRFVNQWRNICQGAKRSGGRRGPFYEHSGEC